MKSVVAVFRALWRALWRALGAVLGRAAWSRALAAAAAAATAATLWRGRPGAWREVPAWREGLTPSKDEVERRCGANPGQSFESLFGEGASTPALKKACKRARRGALGEAKNRDDEDIKCAPCKLGGLRKKFPCRHPVKGQYACCEAKGDGSADLGRCGMNSRGEDMARDAAASKQPPVKVADGCSFYARVSTTNSKGKQTWVCPPYAPIKTTLNWGSSKDGSKDTWQCAESRKCRDLARLANGVDDMNYDRKKATSAPTTAPPSGGGDGVCPSNATPGCYQGKYATVNGRNGCYVDETAPVRGGINMPRKRYIGPARCT